MRRTRTALLLPALTLALGAPAAAHADRVIRVSGTSVRAIGPFDTLRDSSLGAGVHAFGRPSSRRRRAKTECDVGWRRIGVSIAFVSFGAGEACGARTGHAQVAVVRGRGWHTPRGLFVGSSLGRLRRLYPGASHRGARWALVRARSPYGAGASFTVLAAVISGGRVSSFRMFVGGAGD